MHDPVMYIFLNKGLKMSTGKAAAQAAHAAIEAYKISSVENIEMWYWGGHYKKVILEARNEVHLHTIRNYLMDRGFKISTIIDEGKTEIQPHQITAVGVEIVDKLDPHVAASFSSFQSYKDKRNKYIDMILFILYYVPVGILAASCLSLLF